MDHDLFSKVEETVLRHYASRNARNMDINGTHVLVTLDNPPTQYYLGTVEQVLNGELPECDKEN